MSNVSDLPLAPADARIERNGRDTATLADRVQSLRLSGRASARKSPGSILPWGLCAILFLAALGFGYRTYRLNPPGGDVEKGTEPAAAAVDRPAPVTATKSASGEAVASSGGVALRAKGYIIPAHQIQVSPNKVSGILDFVSPRLEEGNAFQEGELLARIQDNDFRARRDKSARLVQEAERRLDELTNTWPKELDQARANLNVVKAKAESSKVKFQIAASTRNATSNEQRVEAEAMYNQDLASIVAAEAALRVIESRGKEQIEQARFRVEQARADLVEMEWMLANCEIKAPVSGTILKKSAERGNFVNASALSSGAGGIAVSLCEMADLTDLEVDLKIQEREIASVFVGQKCTVIPEAYQNFEPFRKEHPTGYEGVVSRMMPTADRSQGAIPVRVKIQVPKEEQGKYLRPDMGVDVSFMKKDA